MAKVGFGQVVRDKVTGFQGIATARCSYVTGPDRIELSTIDADRGSMSSIWLDEDRLEVVGGPLFRVGEREVGEEI